MLGAQNHVPSSYNQVTKHNRPVSSLYMQIQICACNHSSCFHAIKRTQFRNPDLFKKINQTWYNWQLGELVAPCLWKKKGKKKEIKHILPLEERPWSSISLYLMIIFRWQRGKCIKTHAVLWLALTKSSICQENDVLKMTVTVIMPSARVAVKDLFLCLCL